MDNAQPLQDRAHSISTAGVSQAEDKEGAKAARELARRLLSICDNDADSALERALQQQIGKNMHDYVLSLGWKSIFANLRSNSIVHTEAIARNIAPGSHRDSNVSAIGALGRTEKIVRQEKAAADTAKSSARLQQVFSGETLDGYFVMGKPIGDCTKRDLDKSISDRESVSATTLRRAQFEKAVRKALADVGAKDTNRVRELLKETQLAVLLRRFV